ncbi:hydrogenase iron-sulfur subunit [Ramlibacter tataouinensis]|uniref:cytochrome b N-terminal domain-containing protein n=1 Tax=Ramlibacter tataouinensis TaxID=94132 RepID=UPI0022F3D3FB|nr:hydrogenase iron-sulfur subunit [Ramlibacter tataouinensis]WBY03184.1 hydrogenase iron-sulfur subunit [Ramlibacter tataouinensis]
MRRWVTRLEHGFDAAFGAAGNPLKQLGALAFLLLWLLAASGVVLYIVLDTSAQGAYRSIEALAQLPLASGTLLRGLHRYGADAFAIVLLLHLLREAALGRFRHYRRYAWLTGVPLLPLAYACAIGGFWLNWDRLGQYSAIATAEWLDALPFLASPLARNFLGGAVGDRLFSLFVFVHIGLPLLLVFGSWAHIQRTGHAAVFPRRGLAAGTVLLLAGLSLVLPVQSQGPAELGTVPQRLALDGLLLFLHPLVDATSAQAGWVLLAGVLAALSALPFLSRKPRPPVAVVDPDHCSGCGRCVDDCPFGAIALAPHPDGRAGKQVAVVRAAACAGCGICAGACPSSTPFRQAQPLRTGIDLPASTVAQLRERLRAGLEQGAAQVVFSCACGADAQAVAGPGVLVLELGCTAQLPPAFVEYALRAGAAGVLVAGCREGGCEYRLGPEWMQARLAGTREPYLRGDGPSGRWRSVWADAGEEHRLAQALRSPRPAEGSIA